MTKEKYKIFAPVFAMAGFLGFSLFSIYHDTPLRGEISLLETKLKNSEISRDSNKKNFLDWPSNHVLPADTNLYKEKIDSENGELRKLNEKGYQNLSTKEINKKYDLQIELGLLTYENNHLRKAYWDKLRLDKEIVSIKGQIDSLNNEKIMF